MARGKRDLAGFGDIAGANDNVNNDNNNKINTEEIGENKQMGELAASTAVESGSYIDELLGGGKKKNELILTGIYLQSDIAAVLDRLGKKGGRGAKSRLVNEALKKMFQEKGLL